MARAPRGFTLIELMIVVAVIAVLAAIVIPGWTKQAQSAKADSEVSAMFAEITSKAEQYKSEQGNGNYLAAATCPASPTPAGADWGASCSTAAGWVSLRVNAPDTKMYCTYAVVVNTAPPAPFTGPPAGMVGNYYYVLATCDMDNQASTASAQFLVASYDTKLQKTNYGQ